MTTQATTKQIRTIVRTAAKNLNVGVFGSYTDVRTHERGENSSQRYVGFCVGGSDVEVAAEANRIAAAQGFTGNKIHAGSGYVRTVAVLA